MVVVVVVVVVAVVVVVVFIMAQGSSQEMSGIVLGIVWYRFRYRSMPHFCLSAKPWNEQTKPNQFSLSLFTAVYKTTMQIQNSGVSFLGLGFVFPMKS